jgi:alanine-glyoxylate transaminase/serine-glyoxylate transaminase/serine-pyruvate transaminase
VSRIPGNRFLHSPGPTHLPDEVLDAMHRQPMDLGDPRVDELVAACELGLRSLVGIPKGDIFLFASNGHGAWEAAIANLIAPGRAALVPGVGHFSESWAVQTEGYGCKVVATPAREGYPVDPAAVEAALRADAGHEIAAVFLVHTDTAAGVTSDLRAVRAAIDAARHPALLVVDVVASLGAAPFDMDALGIDVAIGASQKGLMVPPGLGFVAVGPRGDALARANPAPRFYWDWARRRSEHGYRKFCGTAPLHLLMGLRAALGLLADEGHDAVFARHRRLADAVHAAVAAWSAGGAVDFFCKVPAARSVAVTTIATASGFDPDAIRRTARERFQVAIAGGLGPLAGRVFRIGHLGDLNEAMILGALAGVEAALLAEGVPIGRDALPRAIDRLAITGSGSRPGPPARSASSAPAPLPSAG